MGENYFETFEQQLKAEQEMVRSVIRDGVPIWELRCPGCGTWGEIDDDQFHGRVSVWHDPGCGYHETVDWAAISTLTPGTENG